MEKRISKRELIEWLRKIEVSTHGKDFNIDSVRFELNRLIDEIGIRGTSDLVIGTDVIHTKNGGNDKIVDLVSKTTLKVPDIDSMRNHKNR